MRTRNIIITLLLALAVWGCIKKSTDLEGDLSGNAAIRGRLFLKDPFFPKAVPQSLAGKTVMLRYSGAKDTVNFLNSTITDADGYFSFSNLTEGKQYTVFYNETVKNIAYFGKDSVSAAMYIPGTAAPAYQMRVYAGIALSQKGILFTVYDNSGNALKNAGLCLFTSSTSAGYEASTCDGSAYTLKTDSNGHALFLPPASVGYYVVGSAMVGAVPLTNKGAITVNNGLSYDTLRLQPPNTIHLETRDAEGNPIGNVSVCVFNSRTLFKMDNCDANSFQLSTDNYGKADKYQVPNGQYFFLGTVKSKDQVFIGRDSVTISNNTGIVTLVLKHQ